jgi:hypothetical protein
MNIVKIITDYIDTNTTNTKAVDLFIDNLPDDIDNGIMLTGIGGNPEQYYDLFEQNIEIWSRNKDSEACFTKLEEVFTLLHRKANITISTAYIYFMQSMTDIESNGRDINGRVLKKIIVRVIYKKLPDIS